MSRIGRDCRVVFGKDTTDIIQVSARRVYLCSLEVSVKWEAY
jgi:hypothetical protein